MLPGQAAGKDNWETAIKEAVDEGPGEPVGIDISGKSGRIIGRDTEGAGNVIYSPINPGPLENKIASSFRSSTYTKKVLTEDTVFYRVFGGNAEIAGNYVSRTPQMGGLQSQLDLALVPEWGNTATYVIKVTVPKGTVIYEGFAAPQTMSGGAGTLMGGGNQIYIPEARFNPSWFGN